MSAVASSSLLRLACKHRLPLSSRRFSHSHCVDLVKQKDYPSYLVGLLLPSASAKRPYFAVKALSLELSSLRPGGLLRGPPSSDLEVSSLPARLRLQWWRDRLEEIYSSDSSSSSSSDKPGIKHGEHPVLRELLPAVLDLRLSRVLFERLLSAHDSDVQKRPPGHPHASASSFQDFASATVGSELQLLLECVGVRDDGADHAARHLACGLAVAASLRSVSSSFSAAEQQGGGATRRDKGIPTDLLDKHGVTPLSFEPPEAPTGEGTSAEKREKREAASAALREAVFEFASLGNGHVEACGEFVRGVAGGKAAPVEALPIFMQSVGAKILFDELQEGDFQIQRHGGGGGTGNLKLQMGLLKYKLFGP